MGTYWLHEGLRPLIFAYQKGDKYMFKITKTYTDFNGNERKEDFYFHFTEAEIMKMQMSTKGGLAEMIQKIVATENAPEIIKIFKENFCKFQKPYGKRHKA